jgi:hypothetical protein
MRKNFYFEKLLLEKKILNKEKALELMIERIKKGPIFEEMALKLNIIDQHQLLEILKLKYHFKGMSAEEIVTHNKMLSKDQLEKVKNEILENLPGIDKIIEEKKILGQEQLEELKKEVDEKIKLVEKRMEALKESETFSNINSRDLFDLADLVVEGSFNRGDKILRDGDDANHFYFLSKGQVKVTKKNETEGAPDIFITMISSPEFFGEASIFEEEKRTANIIAESEVTAFQFDRLDFLAFLNSHSDAALIILMDMVKRLIGRIGDTNRELAFERKGFVDQNSVDDLINQLL